MLARVLLAIALCVLCTLSSRGAEDLDQVRIRNEIIAYSSDYTDVSFEYEGNLVMPRSESPDLGPNRQFFDYTGLFLGRKAGDTLVDFYARQYPALSMSRTSSCLFNNRHEIFTRSIDSPSGHGQILTPHFARFDESGSYGRIFRQNMVLGFLDDDDWKLTSRTTEEIDGHACALLVFDLAKRPGLTEKYWVDCDRGAHVLRWETIRDGKFVTHRLVDVKLEQFKASGKTVWLPIEGKYQTYIDPNIPNKLVVYEDPTNVEPYFMLKESLRLNSSISDSRFNVNFKPGVSISDKLNRTRYDFGNLMANRTGPLTRSQQQEILEIALAKADEQGKTLKAIPNDPGSWISWSFPWILSLGSLAILSFLALRRMLSLA